MSEEARREAVCELIAEIQRAKHAATMLAAYASDTPSSDQTASTMAGIELVRLFNDMQISFTNRFIGLTSVYTAAVDELHKMVEAIAGGSAQVH